MLQFICKGWENARGCRIFKNISCYSLSNPQNTKRIEVLKFKNISCYSLSVCCVGCGLKKHNLKTSHVTVYLHPMQLPFGINPYLKTSHVTVYQEYLYIKSNNSSFKNISCYSLSSVRRGAYICFYII